MFESCQQLRERLDKIKLLKKQFDFGLGDIKFSEEIDEKKFLKNQLEGELKDLDFQLTLLRILEDLEFQYNEELNALRFYKMLGKESTEIIINGENYSVPTRNQIQIALSRLSKIQLEQLATFKKPMLLLTPLIPLKKFIELVTSFKRQFNNSFLHIHCDLDVYLLEDSEEIFSSDILDINNGQQKISKQKLIEEKQGWLFSITDASEEIYYVPEVDGLTLNEKRKFYTENFKTKGLRGMTLHESVAFFFRVACATKSYECSMINILSGMVHPNDSTYTDKLINSRVFQGFFESTHVANNIGCRRVIDLPIVYPEA